jgi:hypothetical protein
VTRTFYKYENSGKKFPGFEIFGVCTLLPNFSWVGTGVAVMELEFWRSMAFPPLSEICSQTFSVGILGKMYYEN